MWHLLASWSVQRCGCGVVGKALAVSTLWSLRRIEEMGWYWHDIAMDLMVWVIYPWPLCHPAWCALCHSAKCRCLGGSQQLLDRLGIWLGLYHVLSRCQPVDQIMARSMPVQGFRSMCPATLHACDHHCLSRWACFTSLRTVVLSIPTILSATPFEEGWRAGEKDKTMFFSKHKSLSLWLLSFPQPSAWIAGNPGSGHVVQVTTVAQCECPLIAAKPLTASFFGIGTKSAWIWTLSVSQLPLKTPLIKSRAGLSCGWKRTHANIQPGKFWTRATVTTHRPLQVFLEDLSQCSVCAKRNWWECASNQEERDFLKNV